MVIDHPLAVYLTILETCGQTGAGNTNQSRKSFLHLVFTSIPTGANARVSNDCWHGKAMQGQTQTIAMLEILYYITL